MIRMFALFLSGNGSGKTITYIANLDVSTKRKAVQLTMTKSTLKTELAQIRIVDLYKYGQLLGNATNIFAYVYSSLEVTFHDVATLTVLPLICRGMNSEIESITCSWDPKHEIS